MVAVSAMMYVSSDARSVQVSVTDKPLTASHCTRNTMFQHTSPVQTLRRCSLCALATGYLARGHKWVAKGRDQQVKHLVPSELLLDATYCS
jgi:hypothetical protein